MRRPILVDTGPIVAILSAFDKHHDICTQELRRIRNPLVTCWPVITEASWLLHHYPGAVAKLLSSLNDRPYTLAPLRQEDTPGIAMILAKYNDLGIQLADASLVHLANREGIETVFTLDQRDFSVLRLAHGKKLRMIP